MSRMMTSERVNKPNRILCYTAASIPSIVKVPFKHCSVTEIEFFTDFKMCTLRRRPTQKRLRKGLSNNIVLIAAVYSDGRSRVHKWYTDRVVRSIIRQVRVPRGSGIQGVHKRTRFENLSMDIFSSRQVPASWNCGAEKCGRTYYQLRFIPADSQKCRTE